ncbi:MAG: hypothetical protein OEY23_07450 [Acidimicrobiia bacterium]|nr:hypothetical protein [Acidimicrobiia bacterium]
MLAGIFDDFSFGQGVSDAWSRVATIAPKVLAFVAILIIGRIVAGILAKAFRRVLDRIGFNRVVERAGLTNPLSTAKLGPSAFVAKLGYYALMLIVVQTAFAAFGANNPVSMTLQRIVAYLPRVFVAIAILVVGGFVARAVRDLLGDMLDDVAQGQLMAKAGSIGVMVIAGFAALSQLQIAPAIINGLFYAMLAVVVGSAIVAVGGGGIAPMRRQWERTLHRMGADDTVDLTRHDAPTRHESNV